MVGGEVCKDPSVELASEDTIEVKAMGGDLHDHMGDPLPGHLPKNSLEIERFGRGVQCRDDLLTVPVIDRPDDTHCVPRFLQYRFEEKGGGRLPVGACDTDQRHPVGWIAVKV